MCVVETNTSGDQALEGLKGLTTAVDEVDLEAIGLKTSLGCIHTLSTDRLGVLVIGKSGQLGIGLDKSSESVVGLGVLGMRGSSRGLGHLHDRGNGDFSNDGSGGSSGDDVFGRGLGCSSSGSSSFLRVLLGIGPEDLFNLLEKGRHGCRVESALAQKVDYLSGLVGAAMKTK